MRMRYKEKYKITFNELLELIQQVNMKGKAENRIPKKQEALETRLQVHHQFVSASGGGYKGK